MTETLPSDSTERSVEQMRIELDQAQQGLFRQLNQIRESLPEGEELDGITIVIPENTSNRTPERTEHFLIRDAALLQQNDAGRTIARITTGDEFRWFSMEEEATPNKPAFRFVPSVQQSFEGKIQPTEIPNLIIQPEQYSHMMERFSEIEMGMKNSKSEKVTTRRTPLNLT